MKTELKTGWLSPNGDFYPCRVCEHIWCARKILKDEDNNRADFDLLHRGFAEITLSQLGKKEWIIHWDNYLTDIQKNFLKPYFDDIIPSNIVVKQRFEEEL